MKKNNPKVIWITGASSGIGAALAKSYASPGCTLGLISRSSEDLELIADYCRQKGSTVMTYVVDVTDAPLLRKRAEEFIAEAGFVDLVIANAGIRIEEDANDMSSRIADQIMQVNYIGLINTFVPFMPSMKDRKSGQLVAMSSIAALRGTPNSGAYSASKAAVNLWTECLRLRLTPYNVSVTTLCVGFVKTAMTASLPFAMPGLLSPEEAAHKISKAIASRKRMVTLPWVSWSIWSFFQILPGTWYDKLILWAKSRHAVPKVPEHG